MNVNLMNGALAGDSFTDDVAAKIASAYADQGANVTSWQLRDHNAAYCLGCFECWTHTPGICRIDDGVRTLTAAIIQSDLQVYVSPVTFGGYSSEIKKVLDRSICLVMPLFMRVNGEVHHRPRYERFPEIHAIGILPQPDPTQEAIFRKLVERNAINMHAPRQSVDFVVRAPSVGAETAYAPASDSQFASVVQSVAERMAA